jgi:hypothetical protein
MSDLPPYVINGNLYDALAEPHLEGVVMHAFCVPADRTRLQAWLDRTFADPTHGEVRYEVMGDKVFLGIAEIDRIYTLERNGAARGYTSEVDLAIWIMARRIDDSLFTPRWIPAYLFVDSGPAMVSGREVWGFPKQLGRFDFSPPAREGGGARTFKAEGWVVSPFGPTSKARWAPMFEVRPRAPAGKSGLLGTLEALAAKVVDRVADDLMTFAGGVSTALRAGTMTMAFLKQFPDAAQPTRACYQAAVEATATVTKLRGSGLTDDHYDLRIVSYDTHPYLAELGISSEWQDVGQGIWMDFDFLLHLGEEQWRAGGPVSG